MSRLTTAFVLACIAAAVAPAFAPPPAAPSAAPPFPGWPATLLGGTLAPEPLTDVEQRWQAGFPGRMAHFAGPGGQGDLLVRWVYLPTRKLHPSRQCYLGSGFRVKPMTAWLDPEQRTWSRFRAVAPDGRVLEVRELVVATDGAASLPDVEAWYWHASLHGAAGRSWMAMTWALPAE